MLPYRLPNNLLTSSVQIDLVGCGGSGSQMLAGLARLHVAMLGLGHPAGISLTAWDPDVVTETNVGRQLFSPSDIGRPKADVLINRVNLFYGLDWAAKPRPFEYSYRTAHILITCVDSARARLDIAAIAERQYYDKAIWIDLGNDRDTGQVVWGELARDASERKRPNRLPTVIDLFPDLASAEMAERDRQEPSCSLAASLDRQSLFINQAVATLALNALFRAFRFGGLMHSAWFTDLATGTTSALPIDATAWRRFGHVTKRPGRRRKAA
jgi:PRTRC genetic system ThiF family protein